MNTKNGSSQIGHVAAAEQAVFVGIVDCGRDCRYTREGEKGKREELKW
jgi:hypothetical protein